MSTDIPRLHALGAELVAIHSRLRAQLRRLQHDPRLTDGSTGDGQLLVHCTAFCEAVTRHHTSEDRRAFPLLADVSPELRGVIEKLEEDHVLIAGILQNVQALVVGHPELPTAEESRRFRLELDGLAAILESHFAFEERRIVAALDALPGGGLAKDALRGETLTGETLTTEELFGV